MATIYSVSLGCPKNRVDTERLLAAVPELAPAPELEGAACVLVNTCGFIEPAIRESVAVIAGLIEDITENAAEGKPLLAVAGCLVGRYGETTLAPELPEVDLWLDNREISAWPEKLRAALCRTGAVGGAVPSAPRLRALSTGPSYAWLKISDGCDHACSFCTIPAIRGPFRSSLAESLEAEARELLGAGVKELVLVAQDTTAWGKDFSDKSGQAGLRGLMEKLLPLPGLERLRFMYLYPAGLSREFLQFLQSAGRPFVPYFDVPVQHAHPDVLFRMGRPFARDPEICLDRIRKYFPEAALRTSIIVGFPGETDKNFQALYDFVARTRFSHLGVFSFFAEEGAPAAAMPDQIPERVKEERRAAIMELQAEISEEILADCVGESMEILVDAPHPEWPGLHVGRTWFQAPEADGVTYISGPGVEPGALVTAEIVESDTYDLTALV